MITVLFLTKPEDVLALKQAVTEGMDWVLEQIPGADVIKCKGVLHEPLSLQGPPEGWYGQVADWVAHQYPKGNYLCFVEGAGGVAGAAMLSSGHGVAVVGDWCI